jgi:hypothetical protein
MEILNFLDKAIKSHHLDSILPLLEEFPNGITSTILQSHLEMEKPKKVWNNLSLMIEKKKVYTCQVEEMLEKRVSMKNSIYTVMDLHYLQQTESYCLITANRYLRFTDTCSVLMANPNTALTPNNSQGKMLNNSQGKNVSMMMIMPTKSIILVLDNTRDHQFISTFNDLIESLKPLIDYKLAVQVDEISFDVLNCNCTVKIHDPSSTANLVLWQDQIHLAKLFEIGDLILIKSPFIESRQDNQELVIECGSKTEILVVPRDYKDSKTKNTTKRKTISDLKDQKTRSISIFGRIVLQKVVEGSIPGNLIFGIRIQDETGVADITITNHTLGFQVIRSELGNFVYLSNLDKLDSTVLPVLKATKSTEFIDGKFHV